MFYELLFIHANIICLYIFACEEKKIQSYSVAADKTKNSVKHNKIQQGVSKIDETCNNFYVEEKLLDHHIFCHRIYATVNIACNLQKY